MTNFPTDAELSPRDTGSSHARKMECLRRLPVEENSCPDRVGPGPISVPGCGSTFWSVASDRSAGDTPELSAASVHQSFCRPSSIQC